MKLRILVQVPVATLGNNFRENNTMRKHSTASPRKASWLVCEKQEDKDSEDGEGRRRALKYADVRSREKSTDFGDRDDQPKKNREVYDDVCYEFGRILAYASFCRKS